MTRFDKTKYRDNKMPVSRYSTIPAIQAVMSLELDLVSLANKTICSVERYAAPVM